MIYTLEIRRLLTKNWQLLPRVGWLLINFWVRESNTSQKMGCCTPFLPFFLPLVGESGGDPGEEDGNLFFVLEVGRLNENERLLRLSCCTGLSKTTSPSGRMPPARTRPPTHARVTCKGRSRSAMRVEMMEHRRKWPLSKACS